MRSRSLALAAALLAVTGMTTALGSLPAAADDAPSCPWTYSDASPRARARQVLAQMTLDEKLSMTHGSQLPGYAGVVAPISRLCVPALNLHDGGAGVTMGGTTALPAPIAAAATFDPAAEERYGSVVGQEAHTKGISVNLGPNVNLARDPRGGRIFEGSGEDPYLTGEMATAYIKGVQKHGVMADLKHIAVNDVEQNRNNADSVVDERTLNEIYYPPFEQAVQEGDAASIMAATSLVNGTHANENAELLQRTAKDGWGFDGFVVTDWDGARSTVQAANAGLDLTMPSAGNFGQALTDAVQQGKVSVDVIDDKVLRLLTKEFEYGLFDTAPGTPDATATTSEHVRAARDIAAQGTVLMKNDQDHGKALLPLDDDRTGSIAVIGEAADKTPVTGGGGSSHVTPDPDSVVSVADGILPLTGKW
ncbi:glycoside hydrolase family 3 protein [Streptomyces sp. YJ-C3]